MASGSSGASLGGQKLDAGSGAGGKLQFRVEAADRPPESIAEKVQPQRLIAARRPQIDDAAAQRELAGLAHRAGAANSALPDEESGQRLAVDLRAGLAKKLALGDESLAAAPLHGSGIDRGDHERRPRPLAAGASAASVASL